MTSLTPFTATFEPFAAELPGDMVANASNKLHQFLCVSYLHPEMRYAAVWGITEDFK